MTGIPPPPEFRYVTVGPPAMSLFEPAAVADLFLAAYGSAPVEGRYSHLHLTDLVTEAELPAAWVALEAAYAYSGATFALMQRLGVGGPNGYHAARAATPATLGPFFRACPYATNDPPESDDALIVLSFAQDASGVRVRGTPDRRGLELALRAPGPEIRIGALRVGTLAWHIHM